MSYEVDFPEYYKGSVEFVESQKGHAIEFLNKFGVPVSNWEEAKEKLGIMIEEAMGYAGDKGQAETLKINPGMIRREFEVDPNRREKGEEELWDAVAIILKLQAALASAKYDFGAGREVGGYGDEPSEFAKEQGERGRLSNMAYKLVRKVGSVYSFPRKTKKRIKMPTPSPAGDVFSTGTEAPPSTRAGTTQIDEGPWDKPQHAVIMEAPRRRKIKIKIKKR
jgi:hypothetical protein